MSLNGCTPTRTALFCHVGFTFTVNRVIDLWYGTVAACGEGVLPDEPQLPLAERQLIFSS
ncbi:hypothetical protein PGT21_035252 [Puccinia graminis f. sp. tritici]|uniref:Uncharacterized protein n=1 Tax=Puccinia graminis f. sp. tritici TaxID=56615 RepID=A0A5B0P0M9_PUCGR|nr:hypothetical protein PGT21_035252 [Puccinia graminis f. sp. tritici]KAA1121334.1 hypothetical protein PGTUg99_010313 [Puccinia graminis f. sp. tritici]